nr:DUF3341 domain-containing protein [Rhizobium sp. L1K21]
MFGFIAEFDRPSRLVEAAETTRKEGYVSMDAYSPFPISGLAEALGHSDMRVPWLTLFGGIFGAAIGLGLQIYTNLDYPLNIGGRPLIAFPAFMLITFELLVLFAVLFSIIGMLVLNHLPRLHHPVFDVEDFQLASSEKFFLIIFANDEKFHPEQTLQFLESLQPLRAEAVQHAEEPE